MILQVPRKHVISGEMACRSLRSKGTVATLDRLKRNDLRFGADWKFMTSIFAVLHAKSGAFGRGAKPSCKRGWRDIGGMRGENVVKKIGNDSGKIIRKQRPLDRGQKLHFACSKFDRSEILWRVFVLSYMAQDANANDLYLRKCTFGNPSGLATLFDL